MALADEARGDIPRTAHPAAAIAFAAAIVITTAIGTTAWAPASPRTSHNNNVRPAGDNNRTPLVTFADAMRGYALVAPCEDQGCHYRLWTTATGGDSWRGHSTPLRVDVAQPQLGTFGDEGVLVAGGTERWISVDRGRIWRELPDSPVVNRIAVPAGSLSATHCAEGHCQLEAIEPDGTLVELEAQPALSEVDHTGWQRLHDATLVLSGAQPRGHSQSRQQFQHTRWRELRVRLAGGQHLAAIHVSYYPRRRVHLR